MSRSPGWGASRSASSSTEGITPEPGAAPRAMADRCLAISLKRASRLSQSELSPYQLVGETGELAFRIPIVVPSQDTRVHHAPVGEPDLILVGAGLEEAATAFERCL